MGRNMIFSRCGMINFDYVLSTMDTIEPKNTYKIIDSVYRIREKCDYSDFYITSKVEAEEQLGKARQFLSSVEDFLNLSE